MAWEILAAVGLTCILKYGSILDFIRRPLTKIAYFEALFNCSLCLGFWSGVAVSSYAYFTAHEMRPYTPFIAAAAAWWFDMLIGLMQAAETALLPPEEDE